MHFTKMDMRWGYNNIRIANEDQWKAAFITKYRLFKLTVMFFGLTNSPTTFQWMMDNIFVKQLAKGWLIIYMDDMLHQEKAFYTWDTPGWTWCFPGYQSYPEHPRMLPKQSKQSRKYFECFDNTFQSSQSNLKTTWNGLAALESTLIF